jgi:hypothetical protein
MAAIGGDANSLSPSITLADECSQGSRVDCNRCLIGVYDTNRQLATLVASRILLEEVAQSTLTFAILLKDSLKELHEQDNHTECKVEEHEDLLREQYRAASLPLNRLRIKIVDEIYSQAFLDIEGSVALRCSVLVAFVDGVYKTAKRTLMLMSRHVRGARRLPYR